MTSGNLYLPLKGKLKNLHLPLDRLCPIRQELCIIIPVKVQIYVVGYLKMLSSRVGPQWPLIHYLSALNPFIQTGLYQAGARTLPTIFFFGLLIFHQVPTAFLQPRALERNEKAIRASDYIFQLLLYFQNQSHCLSQNIATAAKATPFLKGPKTSFIGPSPQLPGSVQFNLSSEVTVASCY